MNPENEKREEEQLAAFLAAANKDAALPDRTLLERLRKQSTEAFQAAAQKSEDRVVMRIVLWTGAAVAAGLIFLILLPTNNQSIISRPTQTTPPEFAGLTLGKVLERTVNANVVHFNVRGDKAFSMWMKPGLARADLADGSYQIIKQGRAWQVDEKASRTMLLKDAKMQLGSKAGIDVLALLDLPQNFERRKLLDLQPTEVTEHYGRRYYRFHGNFRLHDAEHLWADGQTYHLEALVDIMTLDLFFIQGRAEGKGRPVVDSVTIDSFSYDERIPEDKFVIADYLTDDDRVGKVLDTQGVVTIRPIMHQRWTPVQNGTLLKPGDWVRTDIRGANAVMLRFVKETNFILGPGTLVEVVNPRLVRVNEGTVEANVPAGAKLELAGPNEVKIAVSGRQVYRTDKQKLIALGQDPLWLKGFKGAVVNETLGSLIALVNGVNVPLTVGYHKVSVDIRDQIARTVIEESFVNRTNDVLEGVFYFPLPQDASISGFGMWIGDQLVEADVVEKQRAREIYETILRERRDPGLLEWAGGNLFKARVYPIPANGEKRIKITYTQVLPLKGSRYRYSYGLQSEMLKLHPLRELAIDVKVNSVVPLKSVSSPTHAARIDKTEHSGHVEFSAQEYTPARDFEVVVEVDGKQADVVMIPHRRGDDGYFMLELLPPGPSGDWERPILPDGDPLELLILADTSASMDQGQRAMQANVIAPLLAALTPRDTINVAACDVECDWIFDKPAAVDSRTMVTVQDFLAKRSSLGWTDLDKAFAAALARSGPRTHIIYIGDGIPTTTEADPVAFMNRLRRLYQGKSGTCHAVTVGSTYESSVLKAIAALGGGSVRHVSGERGPQTIAMELLSEIAQPGLRDLKVEFKGLRAARVYPEELPNVPAGSQQILLGRYLPEGRDQEGEVIVTGKQGDKPVRFSTHVSLKDAEQGNSFIPRLWARMHLDRLLEQGSSEAVRDEIIALSEEYQIITPYTSFLVLESDADRERFKVKRRFRMRDGEKFFNEGRDNANYELVQQQMKRAGNWRLGLRRSILAQLQALGRDGRLFQALTADELRAAWGAGLPMSSTAATRLGRLMAGSAIDEADFEAYPASMPARLNEKFQGVFDAERLEDALGEDDLKRAGDRELGDIAEKLPATRDDIVEMELDASMLDGGELAGRAIKGTGRLGANGRMPQWSRGWGWDDDDGDGLMGLPAGAIGRMGKDSGRGLYFRRGERYRPEQELDALFPTLAASPGKAKEPKSAWPAAALELAKSLLRANKLAKLTGGIEINRDTENFDARWNELTARAHKLELYSRNAWLTRAEGDAAQTLINWCDSKERGVLSTAFQLGQVRPTVPEDLSTLPFDLSDQSTVRLDLSYSRNPITIESSYAVTIEVLGKDRTRLILKAPSGSQEVRILVDTGRHVIVMMENRYSGKLSSTVKFDDFVEVAGCWWAQRVETSDENGKVTLLIKQTVKPISDQELSRRMKLELAGRDQVLFLHLPLLSVTRAKDALAKLGELSFDVPFVLLRHYARSQQWTRVLEQLQQCEQLSRGKPGVRWLRDLVLKLSRRHEELKERMQAEADRLAGLPQAGNDELYLADVLLNQATSLLEANEMLALLEHLKPLYANRAPHMQRLKSWQVRQVSYLQQVGQADEALRLQKQLATDYPHDYALQQNYAQAQANVGEYPAAYAWLTRVLVKESRWLAHEEESLRNLYAQLLEGQGRFPALVEYLEAWLKENPESTSPYAEYLSALIRADQEGRANTVMAQWFKEARGPGEPAPAVIARLRAAVWQAVGQGHNMYTNRLEERWRPELSQTVLFLARREAYLYIAGDIMSRWQFRETDECREVRKTIAGILTAEIDKLSVEQIRYFLEWISADNPHVEQAVWKRIAGGLRRRWESEMSPEVKHELGQRLAQVLAGHFSAAERLEFLRLQLRQGPEQYRATYAELLFEALLSQPWSAAYEDEAFALLEKLSDAEEPAQRLANAVAGLYRLTDRMVQARFDAFMKTVDHPEKLKRDELKKKQDANLRLAREGFADRLAKETGKHPAVFAQWLIVERLYLDTLLDRNLNQVAAQCWEFLGNQPPRPEKVSVEDALGHRLTEILRGRYLVTLANLAARKSAEPALVVRLIGYLDQGIALDPENDRWKIFKIQLLIALDRPKDLEQALQQWIRAGDVESRWRLALGFLLAEQGKIAEAITIFEGVELADELGPIAYRALAGWYMVVNRRELHDRALIAAYKTAEEWQLSRMISARLAPWQRDDGHLPGEVDKDVLLFFQALFEKSTDPQNYLYQLQQFYQATRDARLLAGLADAVVGHSAGTAYPFLAGMRPVLDEVRDEAGADQIVEQIRRVRTRAKTVVDQRALDILEMLVDRRASEIQNQPGPHINNALAALQRGFKRTWSSGEPRLMADLLAGLGNISQAVLAREQLHELETLHREQATGSFDRLHIANRLAQAVRGYGRINDAIDILQPALKEYEDASGGVLPVSANEALGTLIAFLQEAGHYVQGEKFLLSQLKHPVHQQQTFWLTQQLYSLYNQALYQSRQVSLGSGQTLYDALKRKVEADFATDDQNHRYQLLNILCGVYRSAGHHKLAGFSDDLRAFAFKQLPDILKRQSANYENVVSMVAQTVHDLLSPRDGIAFLLDRAEHEPVWFRYNNQDAWSRYSGTLGNWRREVKSLGDLEERLLQFVLKELRRDLETQSQRNRNIYDRRYQPNFWPEKTDAFARTADEVFARHGKSSSAVEYIAEYLFGGLGRDGRAIEILFIAQKQKVLVESGIRQLINYLHLNYRYGESIALLQPLVETRPEDLQYRIWLMSAYFHTKRPAELLALLKDTDAFFHKNDRWTLGVMAQLAGSCLANELYAQAVGYYKEVIPLHEGSHPQRGVGDGVLSDYYSGLARAYSGLHETSKAVDAASAAIVSWGPRHPNREHALDTLKFVLSHAADLDAYVASLDKQEKQSAIVRKAIGQVYFDKAKYPQAAAQVQIAVELQPNDAAIHKTLIECYDKQGDKEGAIRQLLQSVQLSRRDIKLYQDLGRRYDQMHQAKETERAYTSIAEVLPNESESHTLLAEIRQQQNRWPEAIEHWQQVARIRALEPTGLVKLAAAQVHEKQWDQATLTLRKLKARGWPARFGTVDSEVRELEKQIEKARQL